MADEIGLGLLQGIQQQLDVIGEVEPVVATLGFPGLPMAANIDEDEMELRGHVRQHRYPVARAIGIAVNHDDGPARRISHLNICENLPVR